MATKNPHQIQSRLTAIALAVRAEGLIADLVCPRLPVDAENFSYTVYAEEMYFNIPNTRVGRKSVPAEVEFGGTIVEARTYDEALDDFVPQKDVDVHAAQQTGHDPMAMATEGVAILVDMRREQRVRDLFQTQANFATGLKQALSGTSRWSDKVNSTPISDILAAKKAMLVKPNVMVVGYDVAIALSTHPEIVAAIAGSQGTGSAERASGIMPMEAVAKLFGLKAIYVGESFYNAAKPGQAADLQQAWGNHATLARIDNSVQNVKGGAVPTFAATAEWQNRRVRTIIDPKRGIDGGTTVRVAEQVNELILWQKAGYLFTDAAA